MKSILFTMKSGKSGKSFVTVPSGPKSTTRDTASTSLLTRYIDHSIFFSGNADSLFSNRPEESMSNVNLTRCTWLNLVALISILSHID